MNGLSNAKQRSVLRAQLHDHRVAQAGVRDGVEKHHPSPLRRPFPRPRETDMDHFVPVIFSRVPFAEQAEGDVAGVVAEDAASPAGGIFGAAKRKKEDRAEDNPRDVDPGETTT